MVTKIGLISPGEMGAAMAAAAGDTAEFSWAAAGRSADSRARAEDAGLSEVADLADLVDVVDVVLSVCPPAEAASVADQVRDHGFAGVFVDANAIAPSKARELATRMGSQVQFVDGGIIGPPPVEPGTTRLYLAGDGAATFAEHFEHGPLDARVLDGPAGAASALKTCYAANTKAGGALLLAIRALATAEGVDDDLVREWEISQPHTQERSERSAQGAAPKAWRYVGEMHEIGDAMADAGLPDGFLRAAAELYDRMSGYKGSPPDLPLSEIITAVLEPRS